MSIPEQAGKVASGVVEALRGNPLCLAVVVLMIVLSLITYYRETAAGHDRAQVVNTLVERCMGPSKR